MAGENNNKTLPYTVAIEVAKSPEVILNCLTSVKKWWSKDVEGTSWQLNDEFTCNM